eukprot:gene18252-21841_t
MSTKRTKTTATSHVKSNNAVAPSAEQHEGNHIYKTNPLQRHFSTTVELNQWLALNHKTATEIYICYYKKATGKKSIGYKECLDEALCYGWIDGVASTIADGVFANRWTPRRKGSNWSFININKVENLIKEGRMKQAGLDAYALRKVENAAAAFAAENKEFGAEELALLKADKKVNKFFQGSSASYQKMVTQWIMRGVRPETRKSRMEQFIDESQNGELKQAYDVVAVFEYHQLNRDTDKSVTIGNQYESVSTSDI